jgi:putative endopeptidase
MAGAPRPSLSLVLMADTKVAESLRLSRKAIRLQVNTSTTSYYPFRVIGPLSNLQEFVDAFGLKAGDRIVRGPGQRVRIW